MKENGQAFERVLSRCSPTLHKTALRYLRNSEDAADAVQDALLSAFKHISGFEGRSQMSTWLTRIVINQARMQLRRRRLRETLSLEQICETEGSLLARELVDAGPDPEEIYRQAEASEVFKRLLGQLSPMLRRAFEVREIAGFSTLEAAKILGIKEGSVKSQLCRARSELSSRLGQALRMPAGTRSQTADKCPRIP